MANETLTGGGLGLGTAVNKNQSDNFLVAGPYSTIALGGGNHTIVSGVVLSQSTVTISVSGATGGNLVILDNVGGRNTVTAGGPNNSITLNADATNTVTAGAGFDFVFLGSPGTPFGAGFISNVTLSGNGNVVEAGDQNLKVDPGANNNSITAGNGNDSVALSGSGNLVELGNGTDNVSIGGSNNVVAFELVGPSPTPVTDSASIGGDFNLVVEASVLDRNNITVTIAGAIGSNVVLLGNGNDVVSVGGSNNFVVLGNGNDSVSLLGTGFTFVQVGSGLDNVTVNGNGNNIYVNSYNLIATDNVTAAGNSNAIFVGGSGTVTPSTLNLGGASGDFISLGTGSFNVTGSGNNNVISAVDTAASSDNINLSSGSANEIGFGDGSDTITDNGNGNAIVGGSGNDVINASGNNNGIVLGTGNNILNLGGNSNFILLLGTGTVNGGNGSNNSIVANDAPNTTNFYNFGTGGSNGFSLGNGNDTLTDNGNNVTVFAGNGNDVINANGNTVGIGLGNGNNVVSATGTGDTIVIAGTVTSTDTLTVGSNSAGSITSGTPDLNIGSNTFNGNGDNFVLSGIQAGSTVNVFGTNDFLNFTNSSAGTVNLANNVTGDTIAVTGTNAPGTYDGTLTIDNFQNNGVNATIDFGNLFGGVDHNHINSLAEIGANSTILAGGTLDVLLQNHGAILLPLVTSLNASNVAFS